MRICTGIEYDRDHCRVEKMGCVGCYYYNEKEKKIDNLDKGKMLTLPFPSNVVIFSYTSFLLILHLMVG